MKDDIRPHPRPKTKKVRVPSKVLLDSSPATSKEPAIARIENIKPLTTDIPIDKSKRVSFSNIKGNLHPNHWYNLTKEEQIVLLGGLFIILMILVWSSYTLFFKTNVAPERTIHKVAVAPKITTVAAPLTGLQIAPDLAKRPVTGIMIENSLDARPQSGLQDAGVVYEAIAEGGITRFLALFQDNRPSYIGPVRSLRPYYIDFAVPFDASIAHVGGSPEALDQIRSGNTGMKDLDQFFNSDYYWRQSTRDAPHNVYTSFDKLDQLNTSKGYIASTVQSWGRKGDKALKVPTAKTINISISSGDFNSHYDYDAASNSYLRSEGGVPHLATLSSDDKNSKQLNPKVVIALVMSYGLESDGKHSEYGVNGSGNLYVFQDGGVTQGTWSKADRSSQFVFKDSGGADLKLNAGQTWLTAISDASKVTYAP